MLLRHSLRRAAGARPGAAARPLSSSSGGGGDDDRDGDAHDGDHDEPPGLDSYWRDMDRRVSQRRPRELKPGARTGRGPRRKTSEDYWLEAGAYSPGDGAGAARRKPALDVDAVVVGAGVVGLATARALAARGLSVACLEAEGRHGEAMSARSSEVVHAGLYYGESTPRKRRTCLEGRDRLYAYLEARGVPFRRCGKVVVAATEAQRADLARLEALAGAAGVRDLARLSRRDASALEPDLVCASALLSPSTGIFDSAAYADALRDDAESRGAVVATNHRVLGARPDGSLDVSVGGESIIVQAKRVINCAGLAAGAVARLLGTTTNVPETRLAKGSRVPPASLRKLFAFFARPMTTPTPRLDGTTMTHSFGIIPSL